MCPISPASSPLPYSASILLYVMTTPRRPCLLTVAPGVLPLMLALGALYSLVMRTQLASTTLPLPPSGDGPREPQICAGAAPNCSLCPPQECLHCPLWPRCLHHREPRDDPLACDGVAFHALTTMAPLHTNVRPIAPSGWRRGAEVHPKPQQVTDAFPLLRLSLSTLPNPRLAGTPPSSATPVPSWSTRAAGT